MTRDTELSRRKTEIDRGNYHEQVDGNVAGRDYIEKLEIHHHYSETNPNNQDNELNGSQALKATEEERKYQARIVFDALLVSEDEVEFEGKKN